MRLASAHPVKNGGWLHPLGADASKVTPKPVQEIHHINATAIMCEFAAGTTHEMLSVLAKRLAVSVDSLIQLGAAWVAPHNAWAFPMKDEHGNVIGVRLRSDSGKKWAVTGSRAGLFFGRVEHDRLTCVCEGPTDTAAALSIGLHAVGRPSCIGQEEMLRSVLRHARRVLILSDNDDPGLNGATRLQSLLRCPSLIWCPPCKDIREFVSNGGTAKLLEALIASLVWHQPISQQPKTSIEARIQ